MTDKKGKKAPGSGEPKENTTPQPAQNGTPPEGENAAAEVQIAISMAEYTAFQQAEKQSQEYLDGWQRERAEFANYRKRTERDRQAERDNTLGNLVKKYLVILDDLERALKNRPTAPEAQPWVEGIDLIYRKLQNILEAEGVTRIPAETEFFDPTRHEAISQEPSADHESGQIIEVLQQGYLIGERVIRPAMVRVAQ